MPRFENRPAALLASQILFFLNAVIWLAFGVITLARMAASSGQALTMLIVALLMFGNAGAMLLAGWGLGSRRRVFYFLALGVLAINILLTFTDQFGLLDFLTLLIDVCLLGLLLFTRRIYITK